MARFTRLDVINTTLDIGLVPLFYNSQVETARTATRSICCGGLEFDAVA